MKKAIGSMLFSVALYGMKRGLAAVFPKKDVRFLEHPKKYTEDAKGEQSRFLGDLEQEKKG